jgi:ribosomal protein S12 methylthiotransferase
LRMFDRIRATLPDAALRTTVLVGFPGERDQDFQQLARFIEQVRFDHLGGFVYSDAEDLSAHSLSDHVAPRVARQRLDHLMAIQQSLSARNLSKFEGQHLDVLVERVCSPELMEGRSRYQAPEVDGSTLIRGPVATHAAAGSIIPVRILETLDYDLIAEVV